MRGTNRRSKTFVKSVKSLVQRVPVWGACGRVTPHITWRTRFPIANFKSGYLLAAFAASTSCTGKTLVFKKSRFVSVALTAIAGALAFPQQCSSASVPDTCTVPLVLAVDGTKGPHMPTSIDPASPLNAIAGDYRVLGYVVEHVEYPGGVLAGVAGWTQTYHDSVAIGLSRLRDRIAVQERTCGSSTRYVLLGYSQISVVADCDTRPPSYSTQPANAAARMRNSTPHSAQRQTAVRPAPMPERRWERQVPILRVAVAVKQHQSACTYFEISPFTASHQLFWQPMLFERMLITSGGFSLPRHTACVMSSPSFARHTVVDGPNDRSLQLYVVKVPGEAF